MVFSPGFRHWLMQAWHLPCSLDRGRPEVYRPLPPVIRPKAAPYSNNNPGYLAVDARWKIRCEHSSSRQPVTPNQEQLIAVARLLDAGTRKAFINVVVASARAARRKLVQLFRKL